MTTTYSGDPDTGVVDQLRFLCGDTDMTDPILQNEEYEFFGTTFPADAGRPAWLAAANACDAIAGKFARKMSSSVSSLSSEAQQQWEHYVAMAAQYRTLHATDGEMGMSDSSAGGGTLRIVPGIPVLGGGGPTFLGEIPLASGGGGVG